MKIYTTEQNIDGKTYKFEYWYDSSPGVRVWFGAPVDDNGNQIGETVDSYDKVGVLRGIEYYTSDLFYDDLNTFSSLRQANDEVQNKIDWNGIPIDIEWPKGTFREYEHGSAISGEPGKARSKVPMYVDYGYIRETDSSDGEEIDVYVGNDPEVEQIYVIDQLVVPGSWEIEDQGAEPGDHDEFKYMLGFNDEDEARDAYILHMTEDHYGGIMALPVEEFREMVKEHG